MAVGNGAEVAVEEDLVHLIKVQLHHLGRGGEGRGGEGRGVEGRGQNKE